MMQRRDFLGLAAGAAFLPLGAGAFAASAAGGPKRLVVVMLRGAVDGLNVVVPYGDEAYYAARPTIAIAEPGAAEGGSLALDDRFALHPALAGLVPLWQDKRLAFIHAAGSPDPTRSHFDAQLFIENGTPGHRDTKDGWLNRLLGALPGPRGPTEAIAVGPILPQMLRGKAVVANLPLGPQATRPLPIDRPELAGEFDRLYAGDNALGRAYREGRTARSQLMADLATAPQPADNSAPPAYRFPAIAAGLAHLIAQDRRIRIAFVSLGGWDTHVRQGNQEGQLAQRLRPLGDGLAALAAGLGQRWADTVAVVVSEFGRTVRENGDGGTDHGHGNVMWVLGGPIKGGRVYGEWPGLGTAQLYEARDLAITTDYRSVLATILARHLALRDPALDRIFPGLPPARADLASMLAG